MSKDANVAATNTQPKSSSAEPKVPLPKKLGSAHAKPAIDGAVQPKTTAPQGVEIRKEIIRTSLAGAQYWLERGVVELQKAATGATRRSVVERITSHALPLLREALLTLPKHDRAYQVPSLTGQMDQTTRAGIAFFVEQGVPDSDALATADNSLREAFGLPGQPSGSLGSQKKQVSGNDQLLTGRAIEPVLSLLELRSLEAHQKLLGGQDRFDLVPGFVFGSEGHAKHALQLLHHYSNPDERRRFASKVDRATRAIFRVQHWVDAEPYTLRDAVEGAVDTLSPGYDHTEVLKELAVTANELRVHVHLKPIALDAPRRAQPKQNAQPTKAGTSELDPVAGKLPNAQELDDKTLNAETNVQTAHRLFILGQYKDTINSGFDAVRNGMLRGVRASLVPEQAQRSNLWQDLVSAGVGLAIAGSGGFLAGWLGKTIAGSLSRSGDERILAGAQEMIQEAVTLALTPDGATSRVAGRNVQETFHREAENQLHARKTAFVNDWPDLATRLYRMPSERVSEVSKAQLAGPAWLKLQDDSERQTMIAWANFISRAVHGAMSRDPWPPGQVDKDRAGDIALKGSKPNSIEGNVDPKRMDWALNDDQRPMQREHHGILEIHLWFDGHLVEHPGYGMRLDNVGPSIRGVFQSAGMVRNLPINKVVRFYDPRHPGSPPKPVLGYSFLITARWLRSQGIVERRRGPHSCRC
ncbi:MAG: hypothetical protein WKG01_26305 [Kofleriaceae bacterium]